jgi:hypothetical protein
VTTTKIKRVKGKRRRVKSTHQACTAKRVSGTLKFTTTGTRAKATLSRAGRVYASGTVGISGSQTQGALRLSRRLARGRYTLTLTKGHTVIARRSVLAG